nr:MAG TPA: hypothetical protein [Caudoviricetes sp.]
MGYGYFLRERFSWLLIWFNQLSAESYILVLVSQSRYVRPVIGEVRFL